MGEVVIEGRRLDVKDGLDFSFNYSIADVRDPNKRSTEYSKTIKCPSTPSNDELFGNIWDVNISNPNDPILTNIETNFNPNKKAEARVTADGVEVMTGVVQLRAINILDGKIDYEVVFIGKLKNIFSILGDKELNGLDDSGFPYIDFSDLDHDYTYSEIVSSWNNTTGYVYPMLDYGVVEPFQINNVDTWKVEQFRPAVFLKDIVDRIFAFAGFTYTSDFFDSAPFNRLIVPWTNEGFVVSESELAIRETTASVPSDIDINVEFYPNWPLGGSFTESWRIDFNQLVDPNNNWSNANDEYTVPEDGYYSFVSQLSYTSERTSVTGIPTPQPDPINVIYAWVRFKRYSVTSGLTTIISDQVADFRGSGTPIIGETFTETLAFSCPAIELEENDLIWMEVYSIPSSLTGLANFQIDITAGIFESQVAIEQITQGQEIPMNALVPTIGMNDMILSIFKMFNLYIEIEKANETNLIIETRDNFYLGGIKRDWNHKLARDKKAKIVPLGSLTDKKYIYTYQEDEDYDNAKYQGKYQRVYGDAQVEIDNDFVKSEKKVEVEFSPTVLVNDRNSNRIVGRIYSEDIDEGIQQTDHNIRLLYWGGLLPSSPQWGFLYTDPTATVALQDFYPYAGHWNNPITPTLDFNFGLVKELRYTANGYTGQLQVTNANLFNVYHKAYFLEITDKDSKMLTAEFYLTPWDIAKLDFRDQIIVDNSYWRINKVMNYNPFKEGLTKVELIKVLDIVPQEVETSVVGRGNTINDGLGVVKTPRVQSLKRSNNIFPDFQGNVKGQRNRVGAGAFDFKILGNDNQVGEGANNITILGNNNQVNAGLNNVVIINSDSQVVTESNTTIIDGKKQWHYVDATTTYTASDREFVLADATSGAFTVTLPSVTDSADVWINVKKTDSSANIVTVSPGAIGFIDGAATQTLTTQYEAVDFYCDGSNWFIR